MNPACLQVERVPSTQGWPLALQAAFFQLGFGADQALQLWQTVANTPGSWSRDKSLCCLFCSWFDLPSDAEWILLESLELLLYLSPLAPLRARLQLLSSTASTLSIASLQPFPAALGADEASHG